MKGVRIHPRSLKGDIVIPPSKSMSHRSVICASLSAGTSTLRNMVYSDDIHMTMEAMRVLGAEIMTQDDKVIIRGMGSQLQEKKVMNNHDDSYSSNQPKEIFCKESGSTLRFLIPVATAFGGTHLFTGSGRLVERPLTAYLKLLKEQELTYDYSGQLPLKVEGQLKAQDFKVNGDESSQYISGLLMAMPLMQGSNASVTVEGTLESRDYVDLTVDMMAHYGVPIAVQSDLQNAKFTLETGKNYVAKDYTVESDYSQGAFFLVAGQLGDAIHCQGLKPDSKQADRRVVEIIRTMGGQLQEHEDGIMSLPSSTVGTVIDASQCPDIIPILCVLAALSQGKTRVINGQRLRIKESDRIKSTVSELSKLGAIIEETADGMVIQGQPMLKGGAVDGWGDHRIVMALAIASIRCKEPVTILGAEAVSKSYPHFFEDFAKLSGSVHFMDGVS